MNKYIEMIISGKFSSNQNKIEFQFLLDNPGKINSNDCDDIVNYFFSETYINSDFIRLDNWGRVLYFFPDFLKYLDKILDYSLINFDTDLQRIISYFIYSLFISLNSDYYKNNKYNQKHINEFEKVFGHREFFSGGKIYEKNIEFSINFLDNLNDEIIENIQFNNIILNCLDFLYKDNDIQIYINYLIKKLCVLNETIIKYDKEIATNCDTYFNYVLDTLFTENHYILLYLYKLKLVNRKQERQIEKKIYLKIKEIENLKTQQLKIHKIEEIINVIKILININFTSKILRNNLKKIKDYLLKLKRKIVRNFDYSELKEIPFKCEISGDQMRNYFQRIDNNLIRFIFENGFINFNNLIEDSIKHVTEEALTELLIQKYAIDDVIGLTRSYNFINENDYISQYYSNEIENYIKQHEDELINKGHLKKEDYYKYLLDTARFNYNFIYSKIYTIIKTHLQDQTEDKILSNFVGLTINGNHEILILALIQQIEANILHLSNFIFNCKENQYNDFMILNLFKIYVERSNLLNANYLMNVKFIVYDVFGMRIRNEYSHGNYYSSYKNYINLLGIISAWYMSNLLLQ